MSNVAGTMKSGLLFDLKPEDYPIMCRAGAAHLVKGAPGACRSRSSI